MCVLLKLIPIPSSSWCNVITRFHLKRDWVLQFFPLLLKLSQTLLNKSQMTWWNKYALLFFSKNFILFNFFFPLERFDLTKLISTKYKRQFINGNIVFFYIFIFAALFSSSFLHMVAGKVIYYSLSTSFKLLLPLYWYASMI